MNRRTSSGLVGHLAPLLAIGVLVLPGCGGESDGAATGNTAPVVVTAEEPTATDQVVDDAAVAASDAATEDDVDAAASETSELDAEQVDAAIDIARAYFVGTTDFTGDQFEWTLEAAARDDEGRWWARVTAEPTSDPSLSLEAEQIFVYSDVDGAFWLALDMGTGIEPATDERFPEEVRDLI